MSRTSTTAKTVVKTIQWTVTGLLVAAYLLGSVIVGMDEMNRASVKDHTDHPVLQARR